MPKLLQTCPSFIPKSVLIEVKTVNKNKKLIFALTSLFSH